MKKSVWLPILLLIAGIAVYVYYGFEYNAWVENLTLVIIDVVIVVLLHLALKKKEEFQVKDNRNQNT